MIDSSFGKLPHTERAYQKLCGFRKIKEGETRMGCPPIEICGSNSLVQSKHIIGFLKRMNLNFRRLRIE